MSVQCGIWSFSSNISPKRFADLLESGEHRSDRSGTYVSPIISMGYHAFNTTPEAAAENQPYQSPMGTVLTWDGRLDNREELIPQLHSLLTDDRTDAAVAIAAYDRWGTDSFSKLLGDWALVVWDPREDRLLLACDLMGTKQLFYQLTANGIVWSTLLSSLLRVAGAPLSLDERYIAGYMVLSPPSDVTPYRGICPVPAGSFVTVKQGSSIIRRYWDFDPAQRLVYTKDTDYEEHFRDVFATAVRRRLRSNRPVLAELSGGMDSSSIVCMADRLIADGSAGLPRLDTISYYDDLEPNWDERAYFTLVESGRKRAGLHLDVSGGFTFEPPHDPAYFSPLPPGLDESAITFESKRRACMREQDNRVLLSGIGGDEFLGGLPTPIPELADLVYQGQFRRFLSALKNWSLSRKQPLLHLLEATVADFVPATLFALNRQGRIPKWLCRSFVKRHREVFLASTCKTDLRGPLPSFQTNCGALRAIRRQLAASAPRQVDYELRYPYLDRDLLQFLFSIPREQLVRPGRRRSLMRRALVGIVPQGILERRRKAFVVRGPMAALARSWGQIIALTDPMICDALGYVNRSFFLRSLELARQGHEEPLVLILHTLRLELWLRSALTRGVLAVDGQNLYTCDTTTKVETHMAPELSLVTRPERAIRSDMAKVRQVVLENLGGLGSAPGYQADE